MPSAQELLAFLARVRAARSIQEARFLVVNEAFALLDFDQACLWQAGPLGRPELVAASGLAEVDRHAPFSQWLARAAAHLEAQPVPDDGVHLPQPASWPAALVDGAEWLPRYLAVVRLRAPGGEPLGGLWFSRLVPYSDGERALLAWIGQQAGFELWAWRREGRSLGRGLGAALPARWRALSRTRKALLLASLAAATVFPVRLTALAPAEVTPTRPLPVTVPVDGVVADVLVAPNQPVRAGQPLVAMDDTAMRNRLAVARQTLEVARADHERATGKAFADEASRAELQTLAARLRERRAEVAYLEALQSRLTLHAPADGLALLADAQAWRGRPVQTGERILTVADPAQVELTLYVPPDDAVSLDPGTEVTMFLHVAPVDSLRARIVQASYEPGTSPEGHPAYVVKAALDAGSAVPRLGLRGTAKIHAQRVPLVYLVLRKPLRALRHFVGG